ncbi:unnamed protein product [Caenorhabditis brenneri]
MGFLQYIGQKLSSLNRATIVNIVFYVALVFFYTLSSKETYLKNLHLIETTLIILVLHSTYKHVNWVLWGPPAEDIEQFQRNMRAAGLSGQQNANHHEGPHDMGH